MALELGHLESVEAKIMVYWIMCLICYFRQQLCLVLHSKKSSVNLTLKELLLTQVPLKNRVQFTLWPVSAFTVLLLLNLVSKLTMECVEIFNTVVNSNCYSNMIKPYRVIFTPNFV